MKYTLPLIRILAPRGGRTVASLVLVAAYLLLSTRASTALPDVVETGDDTFACLSGGADISLSGTFTEEYYTRSLDPETVIDARAAVFVHCSQPDPADPCESSVYPVNLGPIAGAGMCWAGGLVVGENRLDATWDEMHSPNNAGLSFENVRSTIDGVRIHNVGDGIRPRGGAEDFVIKNVWLSYIRDDCVENDHMNAGLIDDSLFDGCLVGFSARNSDQSISGPDNVWTIQNSLVRLEPMPGPPEGGDLGHKGFFKWVSWGDPDSRSPKLVLYNNVFMAEQQGQVTDEKMGVPPGKVADCANNTMVWLGEGPYPTELPACFTITTDRAVWDDAVADWIRRHTEVCTEDADCDDAESCTIDSCDVATGACSHDPVADGAGCGAGRSCCSGVCGGPACGTALACDDGNECTSDACLDGDTCAAACRAAPLADGTPCSGGLCCSGVCAMPACGADADCDDGDACTGDACVSADTCGASCSSTPMSCGLLDGCCGLACDGSTDPDCPFTVCGNGTCEGNGEDCFSCPEDCRCSGKNCAKSCCGDGVCSGEHAQQCAIDCAP